MSVDCDVLVTDLDNTFFEPGTETVPEGLLSRVREWCRRGGTWIVATGRPIDPLFRFFSEWDIRPHYCIARERFIIQFVGKSWFPFRKWNRRMARLTREVEFPPHPWMDEVRNLAAQKDWGCSFEDRYVLFEDEREADECAEHVRRTLDDDRQVIRNRRYMMVVHSLVGKGRCLDRLARARGWAPELMLAVGDSSNDLDMLNGEYDFWSAAVANAEPTVQKTVRDHGGIILENPGGEGVCELIDHYLMTL